MPTKANILVLTLGLVALLGGCGCPANTSQQADHSISRATMDSMLDANADSPVHTIVMPHDEPVFPPGSGRDEFVTACVVCHSPRYITMQPRFSRATWLSEVKKMKDVYGAHISDEQAVQITDYLFSINGKASTGKGPKGTYGE
jgi:sulfite dehydrogenase (cytochrome) subunit B